MIIRSSLLFTLALTLLCLLGCQPGRKAAPLSQMEVTNHPHWVKEDFYTKRVQPIFDAKCIACHSCYNSPCQLNLTSYEGLTRGANRVNPYDFPLAKPNDPTRLGVDAHSIQEWRDKGFYDVVGDKENSLLINLTNMTRHSDYESYEFHAESSRTCLKPGAIPAIIMQVKHELSMPYGLPTLTDSEKATLKEWLERGSPGPSDAVKGYFLETHSKRIVARIKEWESLLNKADPKTVLSSRYLYEHLFIADINFFSDSKEFFKLVRAENEEGAPREIGTRRPFDPIKGKFFYRFKVINQSIVSKTHTVFLLGDRELNRFKNEFIKGNWKVEQRELPAYGAAGANAFVTFRAIPRNTRYRFFLDNARYFVMTFMKGPVCRGQTALNVINDHFWTIFVDPEYDLSANLDTEFNSFANLMAPPAIKKDHIGIFNDLRRKRWQAHSLKMSLYERMNKPLTLESIWDGDGHNPNSILTIYRHFDSSDVLFGARGDIPKTIWLMDYQIFEDIYYNLVAGYDLFGAIPHQFNTRLYMELSRISSEDMFITLLPKNLRSRARESWSMDSPKMDKTLVGEFIKLTGQTVTKKMERSFTYQGSKIDTQLQYAENLNAREAQIAAISQIKEQRLPKNQALKYDWDQDFFKSELKSDEQIKQKFAPLLTARGPFPKNFPDTMLIKVKTPNEEDSYALSLILNRGHYNVNMLFVEDKRLWPETDSLNLLPSIATSYPNLYLEIKESDIPKAAAELASALSEPKKNDLYEAFLSRYAVSRFDSKFWEFHGWFNKHYQEQRPIESGAIDLNRYLSR